LDELVARAMAHEHSVLLVEDDEDARDALAALLSYDGIATRAVDGVRDALALLEDADYRPCVVLLDFRMPDLDGADFLERVAAVGTTAPIVVLTGDGEVAPRAHALGAAEVILKPIEPEDLRAVIARQCRPR
jgi:DNA-binding NtrC family response regulator